MQFLNGRGCALIAALGLGLVACQKTEPTASAPTTNSAPAGGAAVPAGTAKPANSATPAPAVAGAAKAVPDAVQKLLGRWVRADGGYVLELKNADLSGAMEAGYFNPKSIRVSRAIWMQGGPGLQVAVELNDVGYPGATYLLTYDPQADKFAGQYTQPQMQQTFDIEFVRQAKP